MWLVGKWPTDVLTHDSLTRWKMTCWLTDKSLTDLLTNDSLTCWKWLTDLQTIHTLKCCSSSFHVTQVTIYKLHVRSYSPTCYKTHDKIRQQPPSPQSSTQLTKAGTSSCAQARVPTNVPAAKQWPRCCAGRPNVPDRVAIEFRDVCCGDEGMHIKNISLSLTEQWRIFDGFHRNV